MGVKGLGCALVGVTLVLSGCSSNVPPDQFFGVGRAGAAINGRSASPGGAVIGGNALPGFAVGALPGAGRAPGTSTPSGTFSLAPGEPSPVGAITDIHAGSCAGFQNGTGVSDSAITVGNVADLSGPVPGLFTAAQQAVMAYAAYFNSVSTVCGRKLKVIGYDSQTNGIGDQQADTSACGDTFALVGSVSAFDDGGAQTVAQCGIPDLRTIATTPQRVASPVSFGTDAVDPTQVSTAQYRFIKSATGGAYAKSALIYLDAGAAVPNALAYQKTMTSLGYRFVYTQPIDVTAFNYAPYAAKIKQYGVQLVQFEGSYQYAVRLKQAMEQQGVHPVFVMDSVAYDPVFVAAGGDVLDGMYSYVDTSLFEEASRSPELQLYLTWLRRVAPSAQPSFFGMFAWGAMRLFTQYAVQLGGRLSRATLLAAIRGTRGYTGNGLFAPQDVGAKRSPSCQTVIQLDHGHWVRRTPYPYLCSDVFDTAR